jgi:hypothetical protein
MSHTLEVSFYIYCIFIRDVGFNAVSRGLNFVAAHCHFNVPGLCVNFNLLFITLCGWCLSSTPRVFDTRLELCVFPYIFWTRWFLSTLQLLRNVEHTLHVKPFLLGNGMREHCVWLSNLHAFVQLCIRNSRPSARTPLLVWALHGCAKSRHMRICYVLVQGAGYKDVI